MFNRGRVPRDGDEARADGTTPPTTASAERAADHDRVEPGRVEAARVDPGSPGAADATTARGSGAGSTLAEMMRRLDEMAGASGVARSDPVEQLAEDATTHAAALRATLDAQKQAQRMLALATKVRGEASAQAEQILLGARAAADRLRAEAERAAELARDELAAWAAAQRRSLEQGVTEVLESARQEAEAIRADAQRSAMTEAERTAERYVAEVIATGRSQADAIRADARALLDQSGTMIGASAHLVHRFVDEIGSLMVALQERLDALAELSGRAGEGAEDGARNVTEGPADTGPDERADTGDEPEPPARASATAAQPRAAAPRLPCQRRPPGSLFRPPED
jgi:hypothetical protein